MLRRKFCKKQTLVLSAANAMREVSTRKSTQEAKLTSVAIHEYFLGVVEIVGR